ncbi:MAG: carboxypeptidase-like regulatory domain-containing protein [Geobacteraceae bacterium]|nr:carboxypeptidase-like regulatory domain-containing protein [Geobacteraceae bacterium]
MKIVIRFALVVALASWAQPGVAQECEVYISVQQRCFPNAALPGATISVSNQLKKPVFSDVTNIQGSRRIVVPGNEEYTIKITADGYSPDTKTIRNACPQPAPVRMFFLFPAGSSSCPPIVLPKRRLGDPNS